MKYREEFFIKLDDLLENELIVFHGEIHPKESHNITTLKTDNKIFKNIKNIYLGSLHRYVVFQFQAITNLIKIRPQAIILEFNPRLISNILLIFFSRAFKIKVILWGLGILNNEKKSRVTQLYYKALAVVADEIISYSTHGKKILQSLGVRESKIKVAFNSTVNPHPEFYKVISNAEEKKITIHNPLRLIFVGRLIESKHVIELCDYVESLQTPVILDLYGNGPLESMIQSAKYTKVILNGFASGRDISEAFFKSDLCILPGRGGLAIQHSMSHGCPVICGIADGSQEDFIEHGKNGYIFYDDFFLNLDKLLAEIYLDPVSLKKLSVQSYEKILKFNIDNMSKIFNESCRQANP
jgi:glycosyltransferase involved in cell wall biosynthesis